MTPLPLPCYRGPTQRWEPASGWALSRVGDTASLLLGRGSSAFGSLRAAMREVGSERLTAYGQYDA